MSRKLNTEEYHRLRGAEKQKHFDSMALGRKRPSEKARKIFKTPPYTGLYSSSSERRIKNAEKKD